MRNVREQLLQPLARRVLDALSRRGEDVDIFLLGNTEIRGLKRRFVAGKLPRTKVVDVLAFPESRSFPSPHRRRPSIGEVYLNWDLLKDDRARLAMLLVHGILHCLGYRHGKRRDSIRMETLEKKLWHRVSSLVSTLEQQA